LQALLLTIALKRRANALSRKLTGRLASLSLRSDTHSNWLFDKILFSNGSGAVSPAHPPARSKSVLLRSNYNNN
jgi:hypothetical protein